MQLKNNRILAVVAGAAVLTLVGGVGGAVAGGLVTSAQIKNHTIQSVDLHAGSVTTSKIAAGTISASKAGPSLNAQLQRGALDARYSNANARTITNIGGPFVANSTQLGTLRLHSAGTYQISAYGYFDALDNSATPVSTRLQLAVRGPATTGDPFGQDFGTCFTGVFPQNVDRELTCQSVRTISVSRATTLRVIGFGYNDDQSGNGGGNFTLNADVSAVRVR